MEEGRYVNVHLPFIHHCSFFFLNLWLIYFSPFAHMHSFLCLILQGSTRLKD